MILPSNISPTPDDAAPPLPEPRRLPAKPSKVEQEKASSDYLRGGLAEGLDDATTDGFDGGDLSVLKFHGIYQQYDRDRRASERLSKAQREHSFMVRARIPGGILSAAQWLSLDALARDIGNGSLRLTTRQAVQFHGILKGDLRPLISSLNQALISTLAACGDVMRNVMCCPAIDADPARQTIQALATDIALALAPRTRAYHEIWLDGERLRSDDALLREDAGVSDDKNEFEVEPWYGRLYLPRKFKLAIALPEDNCVDVYTHDCGLIAICEPGSRILLGYNLLVGGGLGMTHKKNDTFARLGSIVGFITPDQAVSAIRTVIEIYRDYGNREDRRHARLKYAVEEFGVDWFITEFNRRSASILQPAAPMPPLGCQDHLGWSPQGDGTSSFGLFIENGRLRDDSSVQKLSAIREIAAQLRPGIRLTPHQNILFTHIAPSDSQKLLEILHVHGMPVNEQISRVRRNSMACPALPTCGLALADAERILPSIIDQLEPLFEELGINDQDIAVRMTGCPNGCARPYTADIAFVGRSPGVYDVYAGGGLAGDRLVDLLADAVEQEQMIDALRPVLTAYSRNRLRDESFSDFWQRSSGKARPRTILTGAKIVISPTIDGQALSPNGILAEETVV